MIPVIIPAYEPDENLLKLCLELHLKKLEIILVDDGSGSAYTHIFEKAKRDYGCIVIRHAVNLGKGRALKDAFNYALVHIKDMIGCVTADSDGQHMSEDIERCIYALADNPNKLILGTRNFNAEGIPFKSRFGNKLTRKICKWLCGINIADTQTGLRAVPKNFMELLLETSGERFEFETNMLIESKNKFPIKEIEINTIYDSKVNHKTHFNPVRDSIRIYGIFGRMFMKFIISSLSACAVDLILFSLFCRILSFTGTTIYIISATIFARIISAIYNYSINYRFVFNSRKNQSKAVRNYFFLAIVQMCFSAGLVTLGVLTFSDIPEVFVKIIVDIFLFFINYHIQQKYIF